MYGEAFLSPIPDDYPVVSIVDRVDGDNEAFLNHRDRKTQYNDPRFEPSLEDHGAEEPPIGIRPDGSRSRFLTADILERRGVNLRNFDLI